MTIARKAIKLPSTYHSPSNTTKVKINHLPLDIKLTFSYSNIPTEYLFKNDGNNLILEGDFGYMTYDGRTYFSSEILFFSPSQHTFNSKRLPLEMQIIHQDSNGNIIKVSVLYKYSKNDYSLFLAKFDFDNTELQDQVPFKPKRITSEINISKYVHNGRDFFVYEGLEDAPPCTKSTKHLILTDVIKVSQKQLSNFPKIILNKNRNIQPRNDRKIYTTFDIDAVDSKIKETKLKVQKLQQEKIELEKLKAANKPKEKISIPPPSASLTNKFNSTTIETVKQEIEKLKNKKMNQTDDTCDEEALIPIEDIAQKVDAYEKVFKGTDLKIIGNYVNEKQTMVIDKEIPKTASEIKRAELQKKYEQWKNLLKRLSKEKDKNKIQILIQIKSLERELSESNYEPYLKVKEQLKGVAPTSFIQLEAKQDYLSAEVRTFNLIVEKMMLPVHTDDKHIDNQDKKVEKTPENTVEKVEKEVKDKKDNALQELIALDNLTEQTRRTMQKKLDEFHKLSTSANQPTSPNTPEHKEIQSQQNDDKKATKNLKGNVENKNKVKTNNNSQPINPTVTSVPIPLLQPIVYDTNLDYDKKIFSMLKIVFVNLIKEFNKLDLINKQNNAVKLLTSDLNIRISRKNFAVIIRKAYDIDNDDNVDYQSKLNLITTFASQALLGQNKLLIENNLNPTEHNQVFQKDIEDIVNKILLNTPTNQYVIENISDKGLITNLVLRILQQLPIALFENKLDFSYQRETQVEKFDREDNVIITQNNANNVLKEEEADKTILGPMAKQKLPVPLPGEGRKAISHEGTIDQTNIYDVSGWPNKCKEGLYLSPININKPNLPEETKLKLNFTGMKGNIKISNDSYKIRVTADSFGHITHGVHRFDAKEINIHVPSEHTFGEDEIRSPMELQIICQDLFGNTAAVSVLFDIGDKESDLLKLIGFGMENPLYALKLRNGEVVEVEDKIGEKINIGELINTSINYVTYLGALTTPPCKKNVQWFILLKKLTLTQNQLEYFPILFGKESNIRGLQQLNNRPVKII